MAKIVQSAQQFRHPIYFATDISAKKRSANQEGSVRQEVAQVNANTSRLAGRMTALLKAKCPEECVAALKGIDRVLLDIKCHSPQPLEKVIHPDLIKILIKILFTLRDSKGGSGQFEIIKSAQEIRKIAAPGANQKCQASPDESAPADAPLTPITADTSFSDIIDGQVAIMGRAKTEVLDWWTFLLEQAKDNYDSYVNNVTSASATAISGEGDKMQYDPQVMATAYTDYENEVTAINTELADKGPIPGWDTMTQEQKDQVVAAAPGFNVDPETGIFSVDTSAFDAAPPGPSTTDGSSPPSNKPYQVSSVGYQAFMTSQDGVKAQMDQNLKQVGQSASQAQSDFNECAQTLTSLIKSLFDNLGTILRNLG